MELYQLEVNEYPEAVQFEGPILTQFAPQLELLSEFISREDEPGEVSQYLENKYSSRRVIRSAPSQIEVACSEVTLATAALLLDKPEGTNLEEYAQKLISQQFANSLLHEDMTAGFVENSVQASKKYKEFLDLTNSVLEPLHEKIHDDEDAQFELIRLLSLDPRNIEERGENNALIALQFACTFDQAQVKRSSILPQDVDEKLARGDFDDRIAEDALHTALNVQTFDKQETHVVKELNKLIKITRLFTGLDESGAISYVSQSEYRAQWSDICQRTVGDYKANISTVLKQNFASYKRELTKGGLILGTSSEKDVKDLADDLLLTLKLATGQATSPQEKFRIAARSNLKRQLASDVGSTASASVVELIPNAKTLVYIDTSGDSVPESDDKFESFVQEYIKSHQGQPKLKDDVENILEYLRNLDLSGAVVRGLKKYKQRAKRGGQEYDLYALKPKDATGLSTSTTFGKKIRVLFTHNDGEIGLLGLVDRDSVPKYENSLGINSSASV